MKKTEDERATTCTAALTDLHVPVPQEARLFFNFFRPRKNIILSGNSAVMIATQDYLRAFGPGGELLQRFPIQGQGSTMKCRTDNNIFD
jgi:hypothetical protein